MHHIGSGLQHHMSAGWFLFFVLAFAALYSRSANSSDREDE